MEILFTKDKDWLYKWDNYMMNSPRGSHLNLSHWLQSYASYGFSYEIGILLKNDEIIGGYGVIIPKVLFMKFYILPHGPVISKGHESELNNMLDEIENRAKLLGCCYAQISMSISSNPLIASHVYHPKRIDISRSSFVDGKLFNYIYCSFGLNWIDFNKNENETDFLDALTPKVRRNIRMPHNKGAFIKESSTENEIKNGYEIIEENAIRSGYQVRNYKDFQECMNSLVNKDQAVFMNILHDGINKASIFAIKSGGYLTNIMGGVMRSKPDIKLGYLLQWALIKKSYELGYKGYNISMGGSPGVLEFKSRFNTETIFFEKPHYHVILKPILFKLFVILEKRIKPYKGKISKFLSKIK